MLVDDDDDGENRQGQGPRERAERLPTAQTTWWKDIHSDAIRRPGSRVAKLFRRRYRVSFERFLQLVEMTKGWEYPDPANPDKQKKVFPQQRTDDDQKIVFVEIKVMLALRWLGSGASFDMLGELSQTSETCSPALTAAKTSFKSYWGGLPARARGGFDIAAGLGVP